jgi:hypothetical protein
VAALGGAHILIKLEFSQNILENIQIPNLEKIIQVRTDLSSEGGRTDMT